MRSDYHWYRCVPMLLVMGTIFFLSHQPGDTLVLPAVPNIDKLLHGLIYGLLALATFFALPSARIRSHSLQTSSLVVLFCLLYGLSDEWHQSYIPGRFSSGWDIAADTIGAVIAVLVWRKFSGVSRHWAVLHH